MGPERTEGERRELEEFTEAVREHTRAVERTVEVQEQV